MKKHFLAYIATTALTGLCMVTHVQASANASNGMSEPDAPSEPEKASPYQTDSMFKEALLSTYTTNPRIIAERRRFEETGESFNQALAGWLPTINLNFDKGRRRNRTQDSDWSHEDAEDRVLSFTQPVLNLRTYYDVGQADNSVKSSGAQLINVTQETLLSAISGYIDVVRDRDIYRLSLNNEKVLQKNLEATRDRFAVGEATRTDTSQSEARLSRAESETIQAKGNMAIAEASFERVIGYAPAEELIYPEITPEIPASLQEAMDIASVNNASIIAAKYTEEAASDAVGANISDLLPTASIQGRMSRSEGTGFTGVDFDSDSILLSVNLPLYRGGAQHSRIRASKSAKSRSRYELLETTNQVRQQTVSAWEDYQRALAAIEAQQDNIHAAEIALDGVQQEQLYGSRTVLDILDAEQELFVARVNLARSERNRLLAIYNLLAVMGKLSPAALGLGIDDYNQDESYENIKYQFIGF